MHRYLKQWSLVAAVLGILALAGCASPKSQPEAASSQASTESAAPSEDAHGESAEALTPAGTTGAIWAQITEEQDKLSAAIQDGRLQDVHHLAFGIRDLVVALADKANAASPAGASKLNGMVEQVKVSASKLDEFGDAGNLSGTQAENAKLEMVLSGMKAITAGK